MLRLPEAPTTWILWQVAPSITRAPHGLTQNVLGTFLVTRIKTLPASLFS